MTNILVVEDDTPLLGMVARTLRRSGAHVLASKSAEQAARIIDSGQPVDLVIADVFLPGRCGLDFAIQLGETNPSLPVIVMSGYAAPGSAVRVEANRDIHVRTILSKPFALAELMAAVEGALNPEPMAG